MRVSTVTAFVAVLALAAAMSVVPLQVAGAQSPSTSVLVPSSGATLSGSTYLDASASNATNVEFMLFGGTYGYRAQVVCTATLTYYGWLCSWNASFVPNGSYALLSYASEAGGSAFSSGVSVTVNNPPPPSTTVLVPASGATLDTAQNEVFDASASPGVANVSIELTVLGHTGMFTATPTLYGWIAVVQGAPCSPDCSSTKLSASIQSVASYVGGVSGTSPPVNVTIIAYLAPPP
jgi:Bacterial Ig domain